MSDREKVINKIEEEIRLGKYWDEEYRTIDLQLLINALALLKEQEPRVLTLDEAVDGNQCYCVEFRYHLGCGWVKCDFCKMYLNGEVAMLFLRDRTFYQQREHYGKLWRLWDKQPTYKQQMEAKWE